MVSILSTFNVGKAKGPDGVEVEINPDALTGGVIRQAQDLLYRHIALTCIFIVRRNRLFARLSLDLLELKLSFAMQSVLYIHFDRSKSSRKSASCIFRLFIRLEQNRNRYLPLRGMRNTVLGRSFGAGIPWQVPRIFVAEGNKNFFNSPRGPSSLELAWPELLLACY